MSEIKNWFRDRIEKKEAGNVDLPPLNSVNLTLNDCINDCAKYVNRPPARVAKHVAFGMQVLYGDREEFPELQLKATIDAVRVWFDARVRVEAFMSTPTAVLHDKYVQYVAQKGLGAPVDERALRKWFRDNGLVVDRISKGQFQLVGHVLPGALAEEGD
jgi:hypothetical protein